MDYVLGKPVRPRLAPISGLCLLCVSLPAQSVVVVGGDKGWEISFDGSISGFYTVQESDGDPATASPESTAVVSGFNNSSPGLGETRSRVQSGLLPSFFTFNVRSPTMNGLTGTGRISFAPVIQNGNVKNAFSGRDSGLSTIELREAFFNIESAWGTVSMGRALALFQRQNYLHDMSLFGVGVGRGFDSRGTATASFALGHSGYGYLYPNYNARIAYKTPNIHDMNFEIGLFDPSIITTMADRLGSSGTLNSARGTDVPRVEAEASYATTFGRGRAHVFISGLYQTAFHTQACQTQAFGASCAQGDTITAWGLAGGVALAWDAVELTVSGYGGQALGSTLLLDEDALDPRGAERDHKGWLAQLTYLATEQTKIGGAFGESFVDETVFDQSCRLAQLDTRAVGCSDGQIDYSGRAGIARQRAWTIGVYHDVTSWLKLAAEYTNVKRQFADQQSQGADVFAVGGFFSW